MEWKDLAPWIAITITLAISILVPLFTQIANNKHQCKLQKEKFKHEENNQKISAYKDFLNNVGGAIEYRNSEAIRLAGASIGSIYPYVLAELYDKLDALFNNIRRFQWDIAEVQYFELAKLISKDIQKS